MNAVNLIPPDQRRGGGAGGGRGVYALLGGLALALVAVVAYVLTSNQISQRRDDLAKATQRNTAASAQVSALQPYVQFAQLEQSRLQTVHDIAASRFDWERAMNGLARVTTSDVWLLSMLGTVAPGVEIDSASGGGGGETDTLRQAEPVPAVELSGCAKSNRAVVGYLSRLRALHGVTRVSFSDAEKKDDSGGGSTSTSSSTSGGGAAAGDCGPSMHTPAFHVVVFFRAPAMPSAAAGATTTASTAPATTSTTPAPSGGTG